MLICTPDGLDRRDLERDLEREGGLDRRGLNRRGLDRRDLERGGWGKGRDDILMP